MTNAQSTADEARSAAQVRGQAEYERIVSAAAAEMATARSGAINEAVPQLDTIVMGVVERVIGRQVDMTKHRDLLDEASTRLTATTAAQAGSAS